MAISGALGVAATALTLLFTACDEIGPLLDTTLSGADLLTLPLASAAPLPPTLSFYVANGRGQIVRLVHPDPFNSLYLELRFPAGALSSVDGVALGPTDSVLVTVEPAAGRYEVTLRPEGLAFTSAGTPSATFVFAAYGDLSVAQGSPTYASVADYAQALGIWEDVGVDRWQRVSGSSYTGSDAVSGRLPGGGTYRVAAPR